MMSKKSEEAILASVNVDWTECPHMENCLGGCSSCKESGNPYHKKQTSRNDNTSELIKDVILHDWFGGN